MAPSSLPFLLVFLLAATASARPCKTLFYFSTTTTHYPHNRSPNSPNSRHAQNPRYISLFFTSTTTSRFSQDQHSLDIKPTYRFGEDSPVMMSSDFPSKFYSSVSISVRDRTRDILSVVGALLFGIGCGVLTAAAMYFLWALFSCRGVDFDDLSSSSSDVDDVAAAKKLGYVSIPTKLDDDLNKPAPPAKEVI